MAEDDVFSMAAEDAGQVQSSDEQKASVARLAQKQQELEREINDLEESLKEKKKEHRRIKENDLPEAMDAVGMSEFKLVDGTKITVKQFYNASIPAERKPEAFKWLEDHEHDGIIKTDVVIKFNKGEFEIAKEFAEYAKRFNRLSNDPEVNQGVHWQTLRAFVKEQIEDGAPLPLDLFGVYVGREAIIKQGK